jgi:small subunit ribosomal protein S7
VSRKGNKASKRPSRPDIRFNSVLVTRFINKLMLEGKKSTAERIFYNAIARVKEQVKKDELEILDTIIRNVGPEVEVKSRRVGGATYQVPVEVTEERKVAIAVKWLIDFARGRKGQPMELRLATEMTDAFNNTGNAIKKREDTHKMAESNKAFAHFRW